MLESSSEVEASVFSDVGGVLFDFSVWEIGDFAVRFTERDADFDEDFVVLVEFSCFPNTLISTIFDHSASTKA